MRIIFRHAIVLAAAYLLSAQGLAVEQPIDYPPFQREFMEVILDYARQYPKAENELKKSALVTARNERFQRIKGSPRNIKDWIGVLTAMGTNSDGNAYVTVSLSPNLLSVSTWNNEFSDTNDHSLIPQKSKVYASLAEMKIGNVVKFSGRMRRAKNLTEEGRMTSPDFVFIFTDMKKIGEHATPR